MFFFSFFFFFFDFRSDLCGGGQDRRAEMDLAISRCRRSAAAVGVVGTDPSRRVRRRVRRRDVASWHVPCLRSMPSVDAFGAPVSVECTWAIASLAAVAVMSCVVVSSSLVVSGHMPAAMDVDVRRIIGHSEANRIVTQEQRRERKMAVLPTAPREGRPSYIYVVSLLLCCMRPLFPTLLVVHAAALKSKTRLLFRKV